MRLLPITILVCFLGFEAFTQIASLPVEPDYDNLITEDWILSPPSLQSALYKGQNEKEIVLSNGLIRRSFLLGDNTACIAFDNLITDESILRGIKPEANITINGTPYDIGGLIGQPNYAFLKREWIETISSDPESFQFKEYRLSEITASFEWKRIRHHKEQTNWPPKGIHLELDFVLPDTKPLNKDFNGEAITTSITKDDIMVTIHYEMYDGIPVVSKWITVTNNSIIPIRVDDFTSEIIAAVEYMSQVEYRGVDMPHPNIHIETDYAFGGMTSLNSSRSTVHWTEDPDYKTQVSYLKKTPCLLEVSPDIGPGEIIQPTKTFTSFKTYILPFDSYDRERNGLAQRKMYRTIAPWTTENPLMLHARFADWDRVKTAIDQAAEVGFEMVILTFGSGFNIEDNSPEYLKKMRGYAQYAKSKGIEIGGYSLLASRSINNKTDVVMPEGQKPTFGNSPCLATEWGDDYFEKLYSFYKTSGFTLLEHDGSYPGDVCTSLWHNGHDGHQDSQWKQFQIISKFYKWCRENGIYLNVPDYYYLTGSNKCAMGYRETNWSLPRNEQLIHARQNIYDGTWTKSPSMGWMFVALTEYHGGGATATIEPLHEHIDHYENMMASNLGAGVQACYRGPRLYDTIETKEMVTSQVEWYKEHREVLEGDIIHLRRPDGRDIDYWLNVNPGGKEKGLLMVFNPLSQPVSKKLTVPLYYAGITDDVTIKTPIGNFIKTRVDREYEVDINVTVAPNSHTYIIFE